LNLKSPSNCIATARIIRVINPTYSNPKDLIVHRVKDNQHFQQIYPPQNYPITYEKHRNIQTKYGKIFNFLETKKREN
jgi:hypothetical protein